MSSECKSKKLSSEGHFYRLFLCKANWTSPFLHRPPSFLSYFPSLHAGTQAQVNWKRGYSPGHQAGYITSAEDSQLSVFLHVESEMLAVLRELPASTQHSRGAGTAATSSATGLQLTLVLPRINIMKVCLLNKLILQKCCCEFTVCVLEVSAVRFGGLGCWRWHSQV